MCRNCLARELNQAGLVVEQEVDPAVVHGGVRIAFGGRAGMIVEGQVLIELKTVERPLPVHEARTYLRLSGCKVGLLKDGLRRCIP